MEIESRIVSLEMRLAELERNLEMVMRQLNIRVPLSSIQPEVERHLRAGNKIAAIQAYREAANCGLKEAKEFVDELERRLLGR